MRWKSKWDTTLRLFGSFKLVSVLHGRSSFVEGNWFEFTSPEFWAYLSKPWTDLFAHVHTGSPSSKYEHRRALALLRNIQNIRICMGKKPIVSLTYENERISIKKQLTLLKMCVTSLLCGPRADLWPFYGFLCKPLYREKTVDIKTNKTAINRPVDHTGET